jgi:hypothetical protein
MHERGVTLLETAIALLVIAFGLLAMGRLQIGMALGVEHARARTEALQHARSAMEALRAQPYADMAAGVDLPPVMGAVAYEREWAVEAGAGDRFNRLAVTVRWHDRRGEPQSLTLASLVADADVAAGPGLALVAVQDSARVFSRHPSVPTDAVPLTGADTGRSAVPWAGPSGGALVLDNATGAIVAHCSAMPHGATGAGECVQMQAYLLQGYIEGRALRSVAMVFHALEHVAAAPECIVDDAVDPSTGRRLPQTRRYRCLIRPGDHDRQSATPPVWSGRVSLAGLDDDATVCRYEPADAAFDTGADAGTYTLVSRSLDHQNYAVVTNGACPRGSIPLAPA